MLPVKKKEYTEKQLVFLDALFNEANGDPIKACAIAEYSPKNHYHVVKALKKEILERAETTLALHSAKAVKTIVDHMGDDAVNPGAKLRMLAAKEVLDRIGLVKKEKLEIDARVAHGIFIMPAKDVVKDPTLIIGEVVENTET